MFSIDNLRLKSHSLEKEIQLLQNYLDHNATDDSLVSRKEKGYYRYARKFKNEEGKPDEVYLSQEDIAEIRKLAYINYSKARLKDARGEKSAIDHLVRFYDQERRVTEYLSLHPGVAAVLQNDPDFQTSALESDLQKKADQWKNAPYNRSTRNPKDLKYPTIVPGLLVRSKAEADIISRFEHFGAAYHYEEEWETPEHLINLYGRNGFAFHPDFKVKNMRTGNVFWWEHQGKWDDPKYVADLAQRESFLYKMGLVPWKNLIITTETLSRPLDILWVDEIIQFFLL
ncbi:MAG: hypothetical protein J5483_03805 [Lachnospiraceae bacterium]|nr:hypothetical protein [Lachnospiraceae bacterium]